MAKRKTQKLEKNIEKLLSRLPLFFKKLHPKRLYDGTYVEGEPFDYIVIDNGITYCFDAKEQNDDVLYEKEIPMHQFNDLLKAENNGAIVFFMIYFVPHNKLMFIHPNTILEEGKASIFSKEMDCEFKKNIKKYLKS